jgi:hypothetical protein
MYAKLKRKAGFENFKEVLSYNDVFKESINHIERYS